MDISWKRIIYLICAIQVGAGITIIGVLSFIPLYLVDLGLTNQGVTPDTRPAHIAASP